jgi:hypothetical protein
MNPRSDTSGHDCELGTLVEDIRVRVLNCSATGCLLECNKRMGVGTVAALHMSLGGRTFSDLVKVLRCEALDLRAAAALYHVATEFLSTAPASAGSIRHVMRCDCSELAGWLTSDDQE